MFERFTTQALDVISMADAEASRLGHNTTGSEALLLGLIRDKSNTRSRHSARFRPAPTSPPIAATILNSMGVNLNDARVEVEKIIGHGSDKMTAQTSFTPPVKRLIEVSCWREAQNLGVDYTATTHLLLGLIKEKDSEEHALAVLKHFDVDLAKLEEQLIKAQSEVESEGVPHPMLHNLGLQHKVKCKVEKVLSEGYEVSVESIQPKGFMSNKLRSDTVSLKPGDVVDARFQGDSDQMVPQFKLCDKDKEERLFQAMSRSIEKNEP